MARYVITGSDTVIGGKQNDVYVIDPDNLGQVQITDRGGSGDTLLVYDRPGRTAGEFVIEGTDLVWRNYEGDTVRIALNPDGSSPIEYFRWDRLAEDGNPYTQINRILLPGQAITTCNVTVAGTAASEQVAAPNFATSQKGWAEIYGNAGDDTLIGSNNAYFILYGGAGNDLLTGNGSASEDFLGDSGNDVLRGLGGGDDLDGGTGKDKIFGGTGDDNITGGAGNDLLSGGAGRDVFLFNPKEVGIDSITDYATGDRLVFAGIAAGKVHAVQMGDDVQVTIGSWGQVTVEHTLLANLVLDFT